ncbi:MAG: FCD domain-containing protein [Acinetobacter sp.]|nr:FCD domain-containing protein [Acinetobacter sp.]
MKVFEKVIQQLQRLIRQQQLQIGDKLPAERQLCEQFGVSRSSLRLAIAELSQQGILESRLGDGTYIKQLNHQMQAIDTARAYQILPLPLISDLISQDPSYRFDVQEARLVLEGGTAWYAAQRATEQDRAKIRYHYEQVAYYQAQNDGEQAAIHDAQFHLAIAEASHNVILIQMMRELVDLLQFNILLGRSKVYNEPIRFDQLQQQHFDILSAIERQDDVSARHAICHHIEYVIQQVRQIDEAEARLKRSTRKLL